MKLVLECPWCALPLIFHRVAQNENYYQRDTMQARVLTIVVRLCVCLSVSVTRRYLYIKGGL